MVPGRDVPSHLCNTLITHVHLLWEVQVVTYAPFLMKEINFSVESYGHYFSDPDPVCQGRV